MVELYLHSRVSTRGVALDLLSTWTTSPFLYIFTSSPDGSLETFVTIYGTIPGHVPECSKLHILEIPMFL
jgi:hypothetical protein